MSTQPKHLKLTTDQREFVMDRLLSDIPYAEIIEDFNRMYPHVCEAFDAKVFHDRLHGQLRKMKHDGLDTESASSSDPLIPIANPYYRLQYLDKMLHDTPDIEVVAFDGNGNPKKRSNRSDKLKMLELAERIFENMFGVDDADVREELPKMVDGSSLPRPPEQSDQGVSDANS